jgi:hypothetical protein
LEVGGALRLRLEAGSSWQKSEVGSQRSEDRRQKAVTLSVISYSLFGRSVSMSCPDDFYDFYDFYAFYAFYGLPFTI